jgi:2-oxoglutarate ferredoxin oxidoreductase subunit beta
VLELPQHDGSVMRLRKLHAGYDPTDRVAAMNHVQAVQASGELITGLLFIDPDANDMHEAMRTPRRPLNALDEADLCPGAAALAKINAALR